jgi:hypothetical protein
MNWRKLHRQLAPWLFVILAVSALTGMGYRLGRRWFGLERDSVGWLMDLHTGEWLGGALSPFYVLVAGLGLVFLLGTGLVMLRQRGSKIRVRVWHRVLGAVLLLPLLATAVSGAAYKVGHAWFGWGKGDGDWLMTIHEGAWLGPDLKPFYVLLTGGGLLALGVLGVAIILRRKSHGHAA